MDGIAAVSARVQQIQGLVQGLGGGRQVASVTTAGSASLATTTGANGAAGTTTRIASGTAGAQSFEAALAQAQAKGAASGQQAAAPAGASTGSRGVDSDGVPLDLVRYGNGKVPASALQPIGVGDHRLWAPAADAFTRLKAAARADGVTIGVTDSYRSYEAQVDVARRKGLYKDGGLAAVPGTSDHGWGLSLDLKLDNRAQSWMRANAGRFGFDENTPREPWHWTFQP